MATDPEFSLGEGAGETMKNVVAAMIGDYVDVEKPDDDRVMDEIEKYLGSLPSLYRMAMVWILRGLEVTPLAMGYRHQFSNLSREDQVKVLDAFEKSSNYIQRGIVMALKTAVVVVYFSEPEMEKALAEERVNPRDLKMRLAREIVTQFHSQEAALEAEEEFVRVFQRDELPSELPTIVIPRESISPIDLLIATGLVKSRSEARRLIDQGGG